MTIDEPGTAPEGVADESSLDVPNCPRCLMPLEPAETARGGLHWACGTCGFAALA